MNNTQYGYGHTKESAKLVREALKAELKNDKDLKISVTKANNGYGGPRVHITSNNPLYIKTRVWTNNNDANDNKWYSKPCNEELTSEDYNTGALRYGHLEKSTQLKILDERIDRVLNQFGENNDDLMTDYFHNTMPLFYGVNS